MSHTACFLSPSAGTFGSRSSISGIHNASVCCSSGFQIKDERILHSRYKTIYDRIVRYPDGREISFDIEGNPRSNFRSVLAFPYDSKTRTVTFVREYHPGVNDVVTGVVAGFFDPVKHESIEAAIRAELNEEVHLKNGTLVSLMSFESNGLPRDKYSRDRFDLFLALDCEIDANPAQLDFEESIEIVRGVPLLEVPQLVTSGELNMSAAILCLLATRKIEELGL